MKEKTITICGKEVTMRYCAAAETGYEQLSGKSSEVFIPKAIEGEDGKTTYGKPDATMEDYIWLALSAIIASYTCKHQEPPVTTEEIMYDAAPADITAMVTAVAELRNDWYFTPEVIEKETPNADKSKN